MLIPQRQDIPQQLLSESHQLWFIKGGLLCFLLCISFLQIGCGQIPRDIEATERFKRDLPVLTELNDKLERQPPQIVGVTDKGVLFKEPFNLVDASTAGWSESDFSEYVGEMSKAKVSKVLRRENETFFYIAAEGFASQGWRLGYVYSQTSPSNLISSLDESTSSAYYGIKTLYRPLGNNWYIMVIRGD